MSKYNDRLLTKSPYNPKGNMFEGGGFTSPQDLSALQGWQGISILGNSGGSSGGKGLGYGNTTQYSNAELGAAAKSASNSLSTNIGGGGDTASSIFGAIDQTGQFMQQIGSLADTRRDLKSAIGYATGGDIHIKKANRGKFTEAANRAGMGVQEYASHVLANKEDYSPTLIKRANFARNFGGRNMYGGFLDDESSYYAQGGSINKYTKGNIYDIDEREYNRLKSLGYEIKVLE